jgi:hypothetical protein
MAEFTVSCATCYEPDGNHTIKCADAFIVEKCAYYGASKGEHIKGTITITIDTLVYPAHGEDGKPEEKTFQEIYVRRAYTGGTAYMATATPLDLWEWIGNEPSTIYHFCRTTKRWHKNGGKCPH